MNSSQLLCDPNRAVARDAGRLRETGDPVYVPASAVLTIEGGHCVRVDAPVAEIPVQGWDQPRAYLSTS